MATEQFREWYVRFEKSFKDTAGIRSCDFYPVKFGMTRTELTSLFEEPDDISTGQEPEIVKYDDVEFHFSKRLNYRLFLIFSEEDKHNFSVFGELELYLKLEELCESLTNGEHSRLFSIGHNLIADFEKTGMNRQTAWNTIHALYMKYHHADDEPRIDLVADWLDCICGYIGKHLILY